MKSKPLNIKTTLKPNSRIAVEINIPSTSCKESIDQTITKLTKSVKIPGFRPGKVPKQVIIQRLGSEQIHASALESLMDKSWKAALEQEFIEPLSEPELKETFEELLNQFEKNKDIIFTLETDVRPEPKLKTTKGLKIKINLETFDPKSVTAVLEQSRSQHATLVPITNRAAKKGDLAVISFKGIYQDTKVAIEGGSSDSMDLELEEGKMIPGFIEGIIGMSINETKNLNLTFPVDYHHEESRNRKAEFSITLNDLKAKELPKLDDAFAKQTSKKKTLKELKEELEENLKKEFDEKQNLYSREEMISALANELEVDIPKSLIDSEVRNLIESTAQRFSQQGMDIKSTFTPDLIKSLAESSRPQAEKNVRNSLAMNALAKQENIEINEKEVETKFNLISENLKNNKNIDLNKLRQIVSDEILENKIFNWIEENCDITKETSKKVSSSKSKPSTKKKKKTAKKEK
tara:strand:+ start:15925 stop:17313 length:1389 start_codon:yes stop_codon:yes gene_type:complete